MKSLFNIAAIIFLIIVGMVFLGVREGEDSTEFQTSDVPGTSEVLAGFLVTKVFDGDTIQVAGGNVVRYLGIDTPETAGPHTEEECFGKEATERNKELVFGKKVQFEKDISERDKYGRLLRHVFVGDIHVNLVLVEEGYAEVLSIPPDKKYWEALKTAEQGARENKKGLWRVCIEV